jgi:hypothetical protein
MDIATAARSLSADRLLMLSLLQTLIQKQVFTYSDLRAVFDGSLSMIRAIRGSSDPVVEIQLQQSEQEIIHIIRSFGISIQ